MADGREAGRLGRRIGSDTETAERSTLAVLTNRSAIVTLHHTSSIRGPTPCIMHTRTHQVHYTYIMYMYTQTERERDSSDELVSKNV